jgi:6-phosphogluconolactonase/glucosamine-6-phosphate isomerase/deaminase
MRCIQIEGSAQARQILADRLLEALQKPENKRVLWLVTGGSNITLSVAVMEQLPDELSSKLTIALTDERFGPVGHPDSNFQQLFDAGFQPKRATVVPVLTPGVALTETCERYEAAMAATFSAADFSIAQFGIGSDGHIAGILPGTDSVTNKDIVVAYTTETYTRISLSLEALKRVDAAYAFVFGKDRREALDNLCNRELSLSEEPSQILKQIKESYVYNDQVGDKP